MKNVKRYGMVIGLKKEKVEEYKELHKNVWDDVLKKIEECNIRNYSIYLCKLEKDRYCLFSYFEYTGDDFETDMTKMAADPVTRRWWNCCKPCQIPLDTGAKGGWINMEEVFHNH